MSSIFLIGFMGSGKTTFGKKLAARLKKEFVDLDQVISQSHDKQEVGQLIEEQGFDFFRRVESEALRSLPIENKVIATGGGTPCYAENIDWMKKNGKVVFLHPGEEVIFSRLKKTDLSKRPLLKDFDEAGLKHFIHEKLEERVIYYQQADIIFNPVKENMEELIKRIGI